ncbi:MAG: T9SS type A sorting domain-containing protein [Flavobacteriales bacterium]|nr:T9SS type A sorting domain-containing protein [Flavobacteriales bacterium]
MKSCNYIALVVLLALNIDVLSAQVVIDSDDMPQVDDIFSFAFTSLPIGADASLTGENFIWDYSALSPEINQADTFIAVEDTPFLFQFFFNNAFLFPDHNADYALGEIDVDFGLITLSDTYSYFKSDSEGLRNVGFGANVNGIPSSVRNVPVDWIYEFPMEFGDSHSSYSEAELEVPTVGYYFRTQQRDVEVEGWGTLILPDGEYEVLKVKTILNGQDSIYLDLLEQGLTIPRPEEVRYQWLTPGEIQPILEVSQQLGFGAVVRYKASSPSTVLESESIDLRVYPNPTSEFLNLKSGQKGIDAYSIFDSNGRLVMKKRMNDSLEDQIVVRNFARGEYFILLDVDGRSYYSSFFKN